VFDMRSHGQNPRADPTHHDYAHMTRDLDAICRAVADEFGPKPVFLVAMPEETTGEGHLIFGSTPPVDLAAQYGVLVIMVPLVLLTAVGPAVIAGTTLYYNRTVTEAVKAGLIGSALLATVFGIYLFAWAVS